MHKHLVIPNPTNQFIPISCITFVQYQWKWILLEPVFDRLREQKVTQKNVRILTPETIDNVQNFDRHHSRNCLNQDKRRGWPCEHLYLTRNIDNKKFWLFFVFVYFLLDFLYNDFRLWKVEIECCQNCSVGTQLVVFHDLW